MSKKTTIGMVLLALAVLAATLWLGMRLGAQQAGPGAAGELVSGGHPVALPPVSGGASARLPLHQAAPPWALPAAGQNGAVPGIADGGPARIEKQKQLAELKTMQQALMKSMQETNRADPKQVDALLLKIKQVTGSSTVNGIDIDALRNNLVKAGKMQAIATEMNREASKPGGGDPKKIKAYAEQLRGLQPQTFIASAAPAKVAPEPAR